MKVLRMFLILLVFVTLFAATSQVMAQDAEPIVVPVSGTFDFFPEVRTPIDAENRGFRDAYETEVWHGDIVGEATAPFRVYINPDGRIAAWLLAEFEGSVVGEYEGTFVMISLYTRNSRDTHWTGEWIIMSGTGDFENVQGAGTAWGPGFKPDDEEQDPDIYYRGYIVFPDSE